MVKSLTGGGRRVRELQQFRSLNLDLLNRKRKWFRSSETANDERDDLLDDLTASRVNNCAAVTRSRRVIVVSNNKWSNAEIKYESREPWRIRFHLLTHLKYLHYSFYSIFSRKCIESLDFVLNGKNAKSWNSKVISQLIVECFSSQLDFLILVRPAKQFSVMGDDTANTTVTSADEFVWIDSYNRFVQIS